MPATTKTLSAQNTFTDEAKAAYAAAQGVGQ